VKEKRVNVIIRMPEALQQRLYREAAVAGDSANSHIVKLLSLARLGPVKVELVEVQSHTAQLVTQPIAEVKP